MTDGTGIPVGAGVPPEIAQATLQKLLSSPQFSSSRRLSAFLHFVTSKVIARDTARIDERLIATEVYGRPPGYDPRVDSIVRVEANRLRAKLHDYYEADGRGDAWRIRLPAETYVPTFEPAAQSAISQIPPVAATRRTPLAWALAFALVAVTTMAALVPFGWRSSDRPSSIAVLPFANMGGLADKEYISDGITEQITSQLGRSGKLQVAARRSAQRLKDKGNDVRGIGRQLNVDLVLEGAVSFAGDTIGISTKLYDARRGRAIWSSEFTRPASEVVALRDAVSAALAEALRLGGTGSSRAATGSTNDPAALDAYLQARYLFNSRKPENLWKSVHLYDDALKKDPNFALAYAGLAEDYVVLASNEDQGMSQMATLARQAVGRALAIDPKLPEALLTKAATQEDRDFAVLERDYRAALAANPSNANAHHWWGLNLLAVGRYAEAEAEIRQALLLDPLSLHIGANIGAVYYCSRRYQDTVDQERRILELDPHLAQAKSLLARGYEGLGQYAQAQEILESFPRIENSAGLLADLGHVYAVSGKVDRARHVMEQLTALAKTRHVSPHHMAFIQTGLGNKSEALALLEMSYEQHDAPLAFLRVDPRWDPLRGDPRFRQLVHALSLDK